MARSNQGAQASTLSLLTSDIVETEAATSNSGLQLPHEESKYHNGPEAYYVPLVFALIFLVGVVGNGTLIFTVLRNKTMRNTPNVFIVSLAVGDLLLLLASVPFTATLYTFKEWPYGNTMCKLNEYLQSMSLGVSVFTLTALSGDRYVAIVFPMSKHKGSPMLRTCLIAVAIWVVSLGLAIVDAVAARVVSSNVTEDVILEICDGLPKSWMNSHYAQFHTIFRFVVYFLLPMIIISVFYLLMARILVLSSRHLPGDGAYQSQAARQLEARKKVAKVVLSFVVVFIICWLPRHVYLFWFHFDPSEYDIGWHIFKIVGFCLTFINSCVNPLALYFLSKQFRRYYNRYLFCCCTNERWGDGYEYSQTSAMYNMNATHHHHHRTMSGTTTLSLATNQTHEVQTPGGRGRHVQATPILLNALDQKMCSK